MAEENKLYRDDPQRRDSDFTVVEGDRTVVEGTATIHESSADHTVIDGQGKASSWSELKSFNDYQVVESFPATGGEADIFLLERRGEKYILKLYRYGMNPKEEVIRKTKEISEKFPEHMVRIFEYGHDEKTKRWYEVQEYASHGSLREFITGKPSLELLKRILLEILEALRVFHESNLLHLDLKPSNILIRTIEPLDLVFTDFGVASILDQDLSKKLTGIKGTPLYWSPEAFTGVVGKPADYWSLGMIMLEYLLGSHPFSGVDTKVIMYTLSTKGVAIPENISEVHALLLKGLLTREPLKRWGYLEVKRWLKGEKDIPVYYGQEETKEGGYGKPFKLGGKEYYSLEALTTCFIDSEEAWENGIAHLNRGNIEKWLKDNNDFDNDVRVDNIRKQAGDDYDFGLLKFLYTYNKQLPFILHGKLVSVENLRLFTGKMLRKEGSPSESIIAERLSDGRLLKDYEEYCRLTAKPKDELLTLIIEGIKKTVTRDVNKKYIEINSSFGIIFSDSVPLTTEDINPSFSETFYKLARFFSREEKHKSIKCLIKAILLDNYLLSKSIGVGPGNIFLPFESEIVGKLENIVNNYTERYSGLVYPLSQYYASKGDDKKSISLLVKAIQNDSSLYHAVQNDKKFDLIRDKVSSARDNLVRPIIDECKKAIDNIRGPLQSMNDIVHRIRTHINTSNQVLPEIESIMEAINKKDYAKLLTARSSFPEIRTKANTYKGSLISEIENRIRVLNNEIESSTSIETRKAQERGNRIGGPLAWVGGIGGFLLGLKSCVDCANHFENTPSPNLVSSSFGEVASHAFGDLFGMLILSPAIWIGMTILGGWGLWAFGYYVLGQSVSYESSNLRNEQAEMTDALGKVQSINISS